MKKNQLSLSVVALTIAGCASFFGATNAVESKTYRPMRGSSVFSGCLLHSSPQSLDLILAKDCQTWKIDQDRKNFFDVDVNAVVKKFESTNEFPVCVKIHGRLVGYKFEEDDFLIPSGNLISLKGIIYPKKISLVECSLVSVEKP